MPRWDDGPELCDIRFWEQYPAFAQGVAEAADSYRRHMKYDGPMEVVVPDWCAGREGFEEWRGAAASMGLIVRTRSEDGRADDELAE